MAVRPAAVWLELDLGSSGCPDRYSSNLEQSTRAGTNVPRESGGAGGEALIAAVLDAVLGTPCTAAITVKCEHFTVVYGTRVILGETVMRRRYCT